MDKHSVVERFESEGWDGVLQEVSQLPLADGIKGLNHLMIHFRWEMKDLDGVSRVCEMADRFAGDSTDMEVLAALKAVSFNRAAFFWRGWGDSDVSVTPEMELAATPYAERNLDLAHRLGKTGVPLGRAEWLVGAFDWAHGKNDAAVERFERAAELVGEGDDPLETKMCLAYAKAAAGEDASELLSEIDAAEKGEFYSGQVRSATEVYGK
ncbi:MAG: hypothetical protein ACKVQS_14770 [Fimbriimonadaceae bacterium]